MVGLLRRSVVGALLVAALAACEPPPPPPPPPPVIEVNSIVAAEDSDPGDGVCETAAGNGVCPVVAAFQEGAALGRAVVLVPAGRADVDNERSTLSAVVSGELTIVAQDHDEGLHAYLGSLTVESGGVLRLENLQLVAEQLAVEGTLLVDRSLLAADIEVAPTGIGLVLNSVLFPGGDSFGTSPLLRNAGRFHIRYSHLGKESPVVETLPGGTTAIGATHLVTFAEGCIGEPVTSEGYNLDINGDSPGCFTAPTDGVDERDRVPFGELGCGTEVLVDQRGAARPTDTDGDGVAACESGPMEINP